MSELPMEIDCRTVNEKLKAGENVLLLDCREADEYAIAKIARAKLVPMSEITERLGELQEYKDRPVFVHCHHGGRSMRVTRWLREQGFLQAQNMAGGIDRWSQEIDPAILRY